MSNLNCLFDEEDQVKDGVILFDLSQIAVATAMHTFKEEKITTPMMRHLVLNSLRYNINKFKKENYTKVIVCVDNATSGYWRRDKAYYYKKNRAVLRAEAKEKNTFDWEGYFNAMRVIVDELKTYMPYTVMDIDKIEADDHIAIISGILYIQGIPVMVVSGDSDFGQLQKYPNVQQYSPTLKKFVVTKTGSPALDCMTKVIKGDKKDGVAAITVRSDFWFTKLDGERTPPTKATFVEECLDAGDDIIKLLTETQYQRFLENRVLIDFDYIDSDIASQIKAYYESYKVPPRGKMYPYFVKSGLSKLTKHINEF